MAFTLLTKVVTTAGTRVRLSATSLRVSQVLIQAKAANTGKIYVGDATVTSTLAVQLEAPAAGQVLPYVSIAGTGVGNTIDLINIWLDAAVNGEGIMAFYEIF